MVLRNCETTITSNLKNYRDNKTKFKTCAPNEVEDCVREIYEMGQINHKAQTEKKTLLAKFMDLKLLEAFLEAGPQLVFQIMVVMQDGMTSNNQWITILTSALSLTWSSAELYLKYPTEVS